MFGPHNGRNGMAGSLRIALPFCLVLSVASVLDARGQALGYAVAGPAGISGFFNTSLSSAHVAGGGEVLAGGVIGVAGELGVLANASSALWVASANGVVHLASTSLSPFLSAG